MFVLVNPNGTGKTHACEIKKEWQNIPTRPKAAWANPFCCVPRQDWDAHFYGHNGSEPDLKVTCKFCIARIKRRISYLEKLISD